MQGNNQSGINDDELNKMIASIQNEQRQGGAAPAGNTVQNSGSNKVIQPPVPAPTAPSVPTQSSPTASDPILSMTPTPNPAPAPTSISAPSPITTPATRTTQAAVSNESLAELKRETIAELRPLVDKLNIDPADKFDALLLMIRTTDDGSLLTDAHKTAMQIADDSRRAQALLDVIKEIDYFSNRQ